MKTAAFILIATLVFNVIAPPLAHAAAELRGDDVGPDSLTLGAKRELQGRRVRLKVPAISPEWIIGRYTGSVQDTLQILSERGAERIPRALVEELEVSMGRHPNTVKGLGIGFFAGLAAAFLIYPHGVFDDYRGEEADGLVGLERIVAAGLAVPIATICGIVIGSGIETEKWVEVPPSRINLSIAPTREKGLRAALSFKF